MASKKNETPGNCSLCGHRYNGYAFKGGYVCEACLHFIREDSPPV